MKRRLIRLLKIVAITVAAVYVGGCALLFSVQRKLIFPAPVEAETPSFEGSELVRVPLAAGGEAVAFYVPATIGHRTVVHFHGNGEQLADLTWLARRVTEDGAGFFAIEYPGYGLAPGETTEESIYAAGEAAVRELIDRRGVREQDLVMMGQSIGTGAATELAARGFGRRLVLITPYTSLADVASRAFGWLPVRLLLRDHFENAEKAPKVAVPVLILHGTHDEVIPYDLGKALSTKFPHAEFVSVPRAEHNTILQSEGVVEKLRAFVRGG